MTDIFPKYNEFEDNAVKIKSIGLSLVIFAFVGLLISCKTTASGAYGNRPGSNQKNFQRIIHDGQGHPILRVTCEYIGKQPHAGYDTEIPWLTVDTDFYNIRFENLTRKKIRFISKKTYQRDPHEFQGGKVNPPPILLEFTDFLKTPDSDFEDLEPLENRKLINWAVNTDNQITRSVSSTVFQINYLDNEYTFNIFLIYQK